jgi:hypothetical protein
MQRCEWSVVVYLDAQGNDLCESLDLPEYPSHPCHNVALEGIEMCREHESFSSHWED